MADNSFLKSVDEKIGKQKQEQIEEKETLTKERELLSDIIESLVADVETYKNGLLERGIHAEISSSPRHLSFNMKYKDSGKHDLLLSETERFDGRFAIMTFSTSDDGRTFSSTNGASYSSDTWSNDVFIQALEGHINDFLFYANRHGGL
ncbi:hypothetical protein [Enterobacter chuandaensis]|uniref:hypothetical protein n=1 Tax=Enterobacter chuandaensis TaxID=2497875 RepID=UPI001C2EE349|nr:hypothetical protein [Enterobacter chuandaensis]